MYPNLTYCIYKVKPVDQAFFFGKQGFIFIPFLFSPHFILKAGEEWEE